MDLEDLRALVLVAGHGSVKKAAEVSATSRTTLRRRLDSLEQVFGTRLLLRTANGVRPTRRGAEVPRCSSAPGR